MGTAGFWLGKGKAVISESGLYRGFAPGGQGRDRQNEHRTNHRVTVEAIEMVGLAEEIGGLLEQGEQGDGKKAAENVEAHDAANTKGDSGEQDQFS